MGDQDGVFASDILVDNEIAIFSLKERLVDDVGFPSIPSVALGSWKKISVPGKESILAQTARTPGMDHIRTTGVPGAGLEHALAGPESVRSECDKVDSHVEGNLMTKHKEFETDKSGRKQRDAKSCNGKQHLVHQVARISA